MTGAYRKLLKKGDYVLATKYSDADPRDHWCVGFYKEKINYATVARHIVVDSEGIPFRDGGFRSVRKISIKRGKWLLDRASEIENGNHSVLWWARQPMEDSEIEAAESRGVTYGSS